MEATGDCSPQSDDLVQLVPSVRGGKKAKYRGWTYTLETNNGMRYRWRCDVRSCRSRLTTDAYGDKHMVYNFRPHDEDVHLLEAARKKRRSEATYKQAVTKIGDYGYVLENRVGSVLFWRCEYVSCTGRCRTTPDLRLVAGPSHHLKELHSQGSQPDGVGHVGDASSAMEIDKAVINESHLPEDTENMESKTRLLSFCRKQKQLEENSKNLRQPKKELEEQQEQQHEDSNSSTVTVKSEPDPPPPLPPAADDIGDVDTSKDTETKHRSDKGESSSANVQIPDRSPRLHTDSHFNCPSQPGAEPREAPAAFGDNEFIALSDSEEEDMNEAGDKSSVAGADICEADENSLYKSADSFSLGQSLVTSSIRRVRCADVLEMTCGGDYDSRERALRAGILDQMRRLLEAETDLARARLQTEVLRGRLLRRSLGGFVVKKEPA
ncbi:uncharacterized protein LOC144098654 [Amblyomma americanum]